MTDGDATCPLDSRKKKIYSYKRMNDSLRHKNSPESSDTTERLLDAGRRLFAAGGFEGTSVRSLTAEAGANLGAVTYHFESKEALYHAVLEKVMEPLRQRIRLLAESPLSAPDRLELFVQMMFKHLRENGDLPRFFLQETVLGENPSPEILETVKTVVGTLSGIFREGQEKGTIVEGDPVLMALTVLSQPIYLSLMPRFLARQDLRGKGLPQPEGPAQEHVLAALRRAFVVPQEETP
jgi:AcrR family transcriptional regulator